jgi:hypothetical protein
MGYYDFGSKLSCYATVENTKIIWITIDYAKELVSIYFMLFPQRKHANKIKVGHTANMVLMGTELVWQCLVFAALKLVSYHFNWQDLLYWTLARRSPTSASVRFFALSQ